MCFLAKMAFNNSHLNIIRKHFITIKIFPGGSWGQEGGHAGGQLPPAPPSGVAHVLISPHIRQRLEKNKRLGYFDVKTPPAGNLNLNLCGFYKPGFTDLAVCLRPIFGLTLRSEY